jgi:hypothetical protein
VRHPSFLHTRADDPAAVRNTPDETRSSLLATWPISGDPSVKSPRRSTTLRGYGAGHQALRKRLEPLVAAGMFECARCGKPIRSDEPGISVTMISTGRGTRARSTGSAIARQQSIGFAAFRGCGERRHQFLDRFRHRPFAGPFPNLNPPTALPALRSAGHPRPRDRGGCRFSPRIQTGMRAAAFLVLPSSSLNRHPPVSGLDRRPPLILSRRDANTDRRIPFGNRHRESRGHGRSRSCQPRTTCPGAAGSLMRSDFLSPSQPRFISLPSTASSVVGTERRTTEP